MQHMKFTLAFEGDVVMRVLFKYSSKHSVVPQWFFFEKEINQKQAVTHL